MGGTITADAIVIGGGISGAAISFQLARAGLRVIVLEAATPGAGASGRGAGIIRTYHHLEAEVALALLSLATFRRWANEIGGDCGYRASGFLWIVGPEGVAELAANVAAQRRLGAEVSIAMADDVLAIQPQFARSGIAAAAWEPLSGFGDPVAATRSLHAAAVGHGAELTHGVVVTRLTTCGGRITGVETTAVTYAAPSVVLAAGAWSAAIAATAGVSLPVIVTRMSTGLIRHASFSQQPITFIDTVTDTFFRPTDKDGTAHVSIRDERHNTMVEPSSGWADEEVAISASRLGIERLQRRIPSLAAEPLRAWVGIDGVTPDHLPIYGETPLLDGLYLCVGGNFKGFKVAPAVGLCLAELIVSGRATSADLSPFRLDRFCRLDAPTQPPAYSLSSVA
jgi:sarcosine oxidase subunit beta